MKPRRTVLVLGGVRAGKSEFAVERAGTLGRRVAVVATAEARDPEMAERIAVHRARRPAAWETLEVPLALPDALAALAGRVDVAVVDCLTLWAANLLGQEPSLSDARVREEAGRLAAVLARRALDVVIVSNEVGWGVHPETAVGRRYRDVLGVVNQAVAHVADEVVLLVAGCPLWLKAP